MLQQRQETLRLMQIRHTRKLGQRLPSIRRRCDQFDENFPKNNLPYFPTEEEWTLTPHPSRIQWAEKFPDKYVVNPLQQTNQANHTQTSKPQGKQRRQQGTRVPPNQSTMDRFVGPSNPLNTGTDLHIETSNADAAASFNQNYDFNHPFSDNGPESFGWE